MLALAVAVAAVDAVAWTWKISSMRGRLELFVVDVCHLILLTVLHFETLNRLTVSLHFDLIIEFLLVAVEDIHLIAIAAVLLNCF